MDGTYVVRTGAPIPLDRALRALFPGLSWARARTLATTGKVLVAGTMVTEPRTLVRDGTSIVIFTAARRPATTTRLDASALVHVDADVVVVRKPAGVATVPFEGKERGTLDQLVRALLNRRRREGAGGEVGVVHRLDQDTTGLLVFARNLGAKRHLQHQFRVHSVERCYIALAQGEVPSQTVSTRLVADRGDGRRGSARLPRLGRVATTHVRALERFPDATLVECRLETGRTHQIRIHLAERGHPLLGERVYGRERRPSNLEVPRIMLHAATLGFVHPRTGLPVRFSAPIPEDMADVLTQLQRR
ncbi:MAG: RluA family pseudouridine synthase [Polyangiaceae bacterium]|nr:RluA family pseudouridine synthase [Polyangiaceae bacterium]